MYAGLSHPSAPSKEKFFEVVDCLCISYGLVVPSSPQLEYKKGHEERISKYTTFVDPPEVLLDKTQGQIVRDVGSIELIFFH